MTKARVPPQGKEADVNVSEEFWLASEIMKIIDQSPSDRQVLNVSTLQVMIHEVIKERDSRLSKRYGGLFNNIQATARYLNKPILDTALDKLTVCIEVMPETCIDLILGTDRDRDA